MNEMARACDTHEGAEWYTEFCCGDLMERDHLYDLAVDGMTIVEWIFVK
jgi:hypothetical protein